MTLRREELDPMDAARPARDLRNPTPNAGGSKLPRIDGALNGLSNGTADGVLALTDMAVVVGGGQQTLAATAWPRRALRHPPFVLESGLLLAVDCFAVVALLLCVGPGLAPLGAVTMLGAMATWAFAGLYRRRIALSVLDDLPSLALGILFGLAAAITASAVGGHHVFLRAVILVGGGALALAVAGRCLGYAVILHERVHGHFGRRAVMIADVSHAEALRERICDHPESGICLVGMVADQRSRDTRRLPLLGSPRELARVLRIFDVTDVVIGYGGMPSADLAEVLRTCDRARAEIFMVPRLFEFHRLRRGDDHLWGLPLVRVKRPAQRVVTWRLKRAFDVTAAALALVCAAPLMGAIALAVRLELGPGVIFQQTRIGLNGTRFELLKFRSVRPAPEGGGCSWTPGLGQLGRVGRFIRRYSLDELPQLYNVLRGDMSLVGPRPERPEYVEQFCVDVPPYVHRHRVPVGMTGLSAVNGLRGDTSIEERAHFDNWYIDDWSLWLDIKIMFRTLQAVVRGTGR